MLLRLARFFSSMLSQFLKKLVALHEVIVYERRDRDYFLSTLDRVQELGLSLTGWYDRTEDQGGRIRVIIAQ